MNIFGEIEELKKYSIEDKKELAKKIFSYILSVEFNKNSEQYLDEVLRTVLGVDISCLLYIKYTEILCLKCNISRVYGNIDKNKDMLFIPNKKFMSYISNFDENDDNVKNYYSKLGLADLYEWFEKYEVCEDYRKLFSITHLHHSSFNTAFYVKS